MEAHIHIEGQWKRNGCEDQRGRVEDTGLKVAEEWRAAEIVWAPERNVTVLQKLSEEMFCRKKPTVNIPKKEGVVREKNTVKKEEHQESREGWGDTF